MEKIKYIETTCIGGNTDPKIIDDTYGYETAPRIYDNCPTLRADRQGLKVVEPIVIDGFNRSIRAEKDTIGTLTTNCGYDVSTGNGYGIVETYEPNERFFSQAFEAVNENDCDSGDTVDAYNKRINRSGVCPSLTTRPEGFKTAILPIESTPIQQGQIEVGKLIRVRKLTERECGRLMGVKDEDIDKIASNQSKSSQYHLYGDSIVVNVLMAIFSQML